MVGKAFQREIASVAMLGDPLRRRLYEFVLAHDGSVSRDMAGAG